MFNFLTSLTSKAYLYIIAILLAISLLTSGLLYWQIGKTSEAKAALEVATQANSTLENSLNLKTQSCDITDKMLAEYQAKSKAVINLEATNISAIDALPNKSVAPTANKSNSQVKVGNDEKDVVNLDAKLPQSLIDILQQSSSTVKASVVVHP